MSKDYEYYIPGFSREAWQSCLETHVHPGLALYRFFEKSEKDKAIKRIEGLMPDKEGLNLAVKRQREQISSLKSSGYEVLMWTQTSSERLVCGLGLPSLAENGIFMDRVWGFPYIPGSALKGIAQDQALMELTDFADGGKRREAKRLNKDFVAIFGAQSAEPGERLDRHWMAARGHVIFIDAFIAPNTKNPFDLDIVNPHYGAYYSNKGKEPPADYLSPIPNLFLVLRKKIRFFFAVAATNADFTIKDRDGNDIKVECDAKRLCDMAAGWLQSALVNLGVGGKTSVGYGYFDKVDKVEEKEKS